MATERDPIDDVLREAIELERRAPGMPPDVSSRLASQLAPMLSASTLTASATLGAMSRLRLIVGGLSIFALGIGLGALGMHWMHSRWLGPSLDDAPAASEPSRNAPTVASAPPASSDPVVADPSPPAAATPPEAPVRERRGTTTRTRARSEAVARGGIDAERLLLERAFRAHDRRDLEEALARLNQHRREFPRGVLVEERSALRIVVLYDLGRGEAERAAIAFARDYPQSLHRTAIVRARERAHTRRTETTAPSQTP